MPFLHDIPQFPRAYYNVDVGWAYLEEHLARMDERHGGKMGGVNLDPPFQRAHVWTEAQQIAYVEYQLRGGDVAKRVIFNSPDWMTTFRRTTVLIDGKQRLEAVRKFMRGELPAFGHKLDDYPDRTMLTSQYLQISVVKLATEREVLQLYLNINAGGTPHTQDELDRVRAMLDAAPVEEGAPDPRPVPQKSKRNKPLGPKRSPLAKQRAARTATTELYQANDTHTTLKRVGKLRVYGWQGRRSELAVARGQTREIVAATSQKAAVDAAASSGIHARTVRDLFRLSETGNEREIAQAMTEPGIVFYRPFDRYNAPFVRAAPQSKK